ncbi:glycosyltransferase family 32 protein [Limosilactobacillus caviae]|uniref:Glycosyl transferase n=1 Tax=Limosilactobacillus caviae TaxID=1769424 RepID=A0ABQ2C7F9_9LACO|nr:glycosyltransferase [Limosilactobacillus caviae]MCD7124506.1 glycosyl transferase [Limosilactobacillus caviae]MRH47267.1 glycosyl transferase [Limosilactobacillus reuteri]GGI64286.1 glycosyl transferase [Limosilactobacillus caviae]
MIPKIIHYAWIGNEMPQNVKAGIEMWHYKLPDWKFMFWNEKNYDFGKFKFTKDNYDQKRWAYATDELRYDVVNMYGGFYLDTDMLIKKDLNNFRNNKVTLGFMYNNSILTSFFGAEKNAPLLKELLDFYENNYTKLNKTTNNPIVTYYLLNKYNSSFSLNNKYQELEPGIKVYPREYFCCPNKDVKANYAEHLFDNSWGNANKGTYGFLKKYFKKTLPSIYWEISNKRGIKSAQNDLQILEKCNLKL